MSGVSDEIEFSKELTTRRIKKDEANVRTVYDKYNNRENGQPLGI